MNELKWVVPSELNKVPSLNEILALLIMRLSMDGYAFHIDQKNGKIWWKKHSEVKP